MNRLNALVLASIAGLAFACGTSPKVEGTSSVSGALVVASFAVAPTTVRAIDERGIKVETHPDAAGRFTLALAKGHTYRLVVVGGASSEPIVFPRASRRLDTTVRVSTRGGSVQLGAVRHYPAVPALGFVVTAANATTSAPSGGGEPGECVDGTILGTSTPCADDQTTTSCDGANSHAGETADKNNASNDGECVNGHDATTGAVCSDAQEADNEDADPAQAMAVPDHNAPDDIGGCDDGSSDGETDD